MVFSPQSASISLGCRLTMPSVRIENNYEIYRRRQAIVEHPYGVIKRQWDFYYIMTKKTIKHASADVGLIFSAYNLRRIFNIIDHNLLKQYLIGLVWFYPANRTYFKALCTNIIFENKMIDCEKKYLFVV